MDDIILTTSSAALREHIISQLKTEFPTTDMGSSELLFSHCCHQVTKSPSSMLLSQSKYAQEILDRAGMSNCKPAATPIDTNFKLSATSGPLVSDATIYRSLAGDLQYLTFTRPDIAYVVQQVCLFMHDPREPHFNALKRICAMFREPLITSYTYILLLRRA